jgi:hypothetical protein
MGNSLQFAEDYDVAAGYYFGTLMHVAPDYNRAFAMHFLAAAQSTANNNIAAGFLFPGSFTFLGGFGGIVQDHTIIQAQPLQ